MSVTEVVFGGNLKLAYKTCSQVDGKLRKEIK